MPLRVLQFSDIHFSSQPAGQRIVHDDVREQVLADLVSMGRPAADVIVVAGDIAYSGKREEYRQAAEWLERVRALCGCHPGAILTVPGNHDVDRSRIKISTKLIHRSLRTSGVPQAEAELVALADAGDPCLIDKLAEYQNFAASYGCFFNKPSQPSWSRSFSLGPQRTLGLIGLATVQVCDDDDAKEAMLLGSHQYIIPRVAGVEQMVVMHHPLEWLRDRQKATQYLSSRARILIVGHEHVQDLQKITAANHDERLVLASGALTAEGVEPYIYRYNLIELDSPADAPSPRLSVIVRPRVWSPAHTAFRPDHVTLGAADHVTMTLACPNYGAPDAGALAPVALPAGPLYDVICRLRYVFWRRLEWQDRIRALVDAEVLPPTPEAPLPQSIEEEALRQAEGGGKLHKVWESIMARLPVGEREPNPFDSPDD
jgi:predicted phosphodiesterase